MEKKLKVKFENITPNNEDKVTSSCTKSKSIENKTNKSIINSHTSVNDKSPNSKRKFVDKKGNNVQPFAHLYQGNDKTKADFQKSVQCINEIVTDYMYLEK